MTPSAPTSNLQTVEIRGFLQSDLLRRCEQNPRYSLRAYARALQIEPSALSKLLNGKRQVTPKMFEQIAARLGFSPEQRKSLHPYNAHMGRSPKNTRSSYQQLALNLFHVISDWYHYAILELTQIQGFKGDPKWIASKLGITTSEINIAVERLVHLELLSIDPVTGVWKDESGATTMAGPNPYADAATRKLQKQVLEMGVHALENIPVEERDQSSMTMAIDSKLLPQARAKIKRFRRELCRFLKSSPHQDQVYQLGVSLYPLSTKAPSREGEI